MNMIKLKVGEHIYMLTSKKKNKLEKSEERKSGKLHVKFSLIEMLPLGTPTTE